MPKSSAADRSARSVHPAAEALKSALPVMLGVGPVGVLFGISAAQLDWSAADVALMNVLAFSGSAQFAFLKLRAEGAGLLAIYLLVVLINLRFIPMSWASANKAAGGRWTLPLRAHMVTDEAFALEQFHTQPGQRLVIRLALFVFWAVTGVVGVGVAALLPPETGQLLGGVTFPASALLAGLGLLATRDFVRGGGRTALVPVAVATAAALLALGLLGPRLFWVPSIVAGTALALWWDRRGGRP